MSTSVAKPSVQAPLYKRVIQARLNYVIFAAVFFSIFLAQIIWIVPSVFFHEQALLRDLEDRASLAIRATVEEARFDDMAVTRKIGDRLIAIGNIKGGIAYDAAGNAVSHFGDKPVLSWISVWNDSTPTYFDPSRCCLDIYLSSKVSGLRHDLILRLDASHISAGVLEHLKSQLWSALFLGSITCLCVVFQLHLWIVHPINKLRRAVFRVDENHEDSKEIVLGWRRHDELGDLSRGLDLLFTDVSEVYQEELHAANQAMRLSNLSILHFDPEAKLIAANFAALRLYSVSNLEELQKDPSQYFKFADEGDTNPITDKTNFTKVSGIKTGTALTANGEVPCLISASSLKRKDKSIQRHVVMIIPTSKFTIEIERLENEIEKKDGELDQHKFDLAEAELITNNARTLLNSLKPQRKKRNTTNVLNSAKIIESWTKKISSYGLYFDFITETAMPTISGEETNLTEIFGQAFAVAYLRSKYDTPAIAIRAEGAENGMVEFVLTDISDKKDRTTLPPGIERGNWDIAFTSLGLLLAKEGGKIVQKNVKRGEPNVLSFTLALAKYERKTDEDKEPKAA